MKKILLTITASFLLTTVMTAQVQRPALPVIEKKENQQPVLECCIMRKGKMIHFKNGKETTIVKETKFHGMKIKPNGTCSMKNGKTIKLKEGECCDAKGVISSDCNKRMKKIKRLQKK